VAYWSVFVFGIRKRDGGLRYSLWLFWDNLDDPDLSVLVVLFRSGSPEEDPIENQRKLKRTFVALKTVASKELLNEYETCDERPCQLHDIANHREQRGD